jgi:hypothetical protein
VEVIPHLAQLPQQVAVAAGVTTHLLIQVLMAVLVVEVVQLLREAQEVQAIHLQHHRLKGTVVALVEQITQLIVPVVVGVVLVALELTHQVLLRVTVE